MADRLKSVLDRIEQEAEAPIYALERLREAIANDDTVTPEDARRLKQLDSSGAGRAFGAGWADFFTLAVRASVRGR